MIPLDLEIATLTAGIYSYPQSPAVNWDHLYTLPIDNLSVGFKHMIGYDAIIFEGTTDLNGWMLDFEAMPIETPIGWVHDGFHIGMKATWDLFKAYVTQPVVVGGHSLGAARAAIFSGYMKLDGHSPIARVTFGEPKPGLQSFADYLKDIPARIYRNGDGKEHHDLITDVPFTVADLSALDFTHQVTMTDVVALPTADMVKAWNIFAFHNMLLYLQALGGPVVSTLKGTKYALPR